MPRRHRHDEYAHIGIRLDRYDAAVGKSINLNLLGDIAIYPDDDEPVFTSYTRFEVSGMCICPEIRANERYEITVYGEDVNRTEPKLKDIRARGKDNIPIYRKRRGREIPVYNRPAGFSLLTRNRHIDAWQACIWVAPQLASDILTMLGQSTSRPIYVATDERKHDRKRWIDCLRVQTNNPAEE